MKVSVLTKTAVMSGAGIAAIRTHRAFLDSGLDSTAWLAHGSDDPDSRTFVIDRGVTALASKIRRACGNLLLRGAFPGTSAVRSLNAFTTGYAERINATGSDVLNLHWIGAETLRIEELARLRAAVLWTLHDEWAYCGSAHYQSNERLTPMGSRVDGWMLARKRAAYTAIRPTFVTPSRWLRDKALASELLHASTVLCIPNPVPLDTFVDKDKIESKKKLGLPPDGKVIMFGAVGGSSDPRKGFKHLIRSLQVLLTRPGNGDITLLTFGGAGTAETSGFRALNMGQVGDDVTLAGLYQAADAFICPSEQENFPNTMAEALACGVPCVGFDIGGVPELAGHQERGYVARAFDAADLAEGIQYCLDPVNATRLSTNARSFACATLAPAVVARQYRDAMQECMMAHRARWLRGKA